MSDWNWQESFTQTEWERQASAFLDYNLYQSWAYLNARAAGKGELLKPLCLRFGGQVCLMAHVRVIQLPLAGLKVGYVRWGPVMRKTQSLDSIPIEALQQLRSFLIPRVVHVARIIPNLYTADVPPSWKEDFLKAGWKPAGIAPYHTILFPLDLPEEEMRKKPCRTWRANLKKAEQAGLSVVESLDPDIWRILEELYRSSQKKKGFRGLDLREYVRTQEMLLDHQKMKMIMVMENGVPLTVDVNSCFGDTSLGLFQSTSERGYEVLSSYLAWWKSFLSAKQAGMRRYDLGGVDPKRNPSVYQFKKRIGGKEAIQIGGFDACANPAIEWIWKTISRLHEWKKSLA